MIDDVIGLIIIIIINNTNIIVCVNIIITILCL